MQSLSLRIVSLRRRQPNTSSSVGGVPLHSRVNCWHGLCLRWEGQMTTKHTGPPTKYERATAQCGHTHLVCKDCGAIVRNGVGDAGADQKRQGVGSILVNHLSLEKI